MQTIQGTTKSKGLKIGLVASEFNDYIVKKLIAGAEEALKEFGCYEDAVILKVPGALEIPFGLQELAETAKYDALVGLGVVIRGQTSHYDHVADMSIRGSHEVGLKYNLPVLTGILTTENADQALARAGKKLENRGYTAVKGAIEMVDVIRQLHD